MASWQDAPPVDEGTTNATPSWQAAPAVDVQSKPPPVAPVAPKAPVVATEKPLGPLSRTPKDYQSSLDPSGLVEAAMHMGSGTLGYLLSRPAGLGAFLASAAGLAGEPDVRVGADPKTFADKLQASMTYEPRTPEGRIMAQYNPLALIGKGVDYLGEKLGGGIEKALPGPIGAALGSGAHEAANLAPGFVGFSGPLAAEATASALKGAPGGGAGTLTARGLMQSALKPTATALRSGEAATAIDTMLDRGINVSRGGLEKMQDRVDTLNAGITDAIANSPATVNKWAVASRVQNVIDRFQSQVAPMADVAAIQRTWNEFLNHPLFSGDEIPVQLAQDMKKGTYRAIGSKVYGELKGADVEAQKALARGLKEEIAAAVPEVRPLNAEESQLLNTLPVVERRVLMSANKNPAGLGWLSTNVKTFAGYLADRSDLFKSLVARMLNTTADQLPSLVAAAPAAGAATSAFAEDAELRKKVARAFGVKVPTGLPPDSLATILMKGTR